MLPNPSKSITQKILKDPTVHFNLWVPVIYAIMGALGVSIPVALPVILAAGNGLIRLFTTEPIVVKRKPKEVKQDAQ